MSPPVDWPQRLLPSSLLHRAFRYGNEYAWNRRDAVSVVATLVTNGIDVIGVDVWFKLGNKPLVPSPGIYHWERERSIATDVSALNNDARRFIESVAIDSSDYPSDAEGPYFSITVAP